MSLKKNYLASYLVLFATCWGIELLIILQVQAGVIRIEMQLHIIYHF